jgi:hypothetical protein
MDGNSPVVLSKFWLYWVVATLLTSSFVVLWYIWDRRQDRRYKRMNNSLDKEIEVLEATMLRDVEERTMTERTRALVARSKETEE